MVIALRLSKRAEPALVLRKVTLSLVVSVVDALLRFKVPCIRKPLPAVASIVAERSKIKFLNSVKPGVNFNGLKVVPDPVMVRFGVLLVASSAAPPSVPVPALLVKLPPMVSVFEEAVLSEPLVSVVAPLIIISLPMAALPEAVLFNVKLLNRLVVPGVVWSKYKLPKAPVPPIDILAVLFPRKEPFELLAVPNKVNVVPGARFTIPLAC